MKKILSKIFKPYEEDYVGRYVHSGVGYDGVEFDMWHGHSASARLKHCGVGYTGVYDE